MSFEHDNQQAASASPRSTAPPAVRPFASRLRARTLWLAPFVRAHGVEVAIALAVAALALFVCITRLEPIENGGDPLDNWYFVRQWAYDNDPAGARIDHHASRFGIHVLTWIAQSLFGTHPRVYYVAPLFASTVATVLTYVLGRLVSGRLVGLTAALCLLECQPFVAASSQLRPAIFETMYALAATVCLVRFVVVEGRSATAWLSATAIFVFLAYLSHEPDAFLGPGAMLVVWLKRRRFRDVLVFGGVLAALVLAETAAYALFTQYWGRIDVLSRSHLTRPGPPKSVGYLFERFTKAGGAIKLAYYPFFLASPLLLVFRRPLRETVPAFVAGSFLFLATFFVRSLDPVQVFMRLHDRYIVVTIPLAYVVTLHTGVVVVRALWSWLSKHAKLGGIELARTALRAAAAVAGVAFVLLVGWRAHAKRTRPNPLASIDSIYDTLNDAYRRRLPIIGKVSARKARLTQVRALHWTQKGFLRDEFFLKNGRLADFKYSGLARLSENERYLQYDPKLEPERVKRLKKEGCALRLSSSGTFVALARQKRLPSRCRPDEG